MSGDVAAKHTGSVVLYVCDVMDQYKEVCRVDVDVTSHCETVSIVIYGVNKQQQQQQQQQQQRSLKDKEKLNISDMIAIEWKRPEGLVLPKSHPDELKWHFESTGSKCVLSL